MDEAGVEGTRAGGSRSGLVSSSYSNEEAMMDTMTTGLAGRPMTVGTGLPQNPNMVGRETVRGVLQEARQTLGQTIARLMDLSDAVVGAEPRDLQTAQPEGPLALETLANTLRVQATDIATRVAGIVEKL